MIRQPTITVYKAPAQQQPHPLVVYIIYLVFRCVRPYVPCLLESSKSAVLSVQNLVVALDKAILWPVVYPALFCMNLAVLCKQELTITVKALPPTNPELSISMIRRIWALR